MNKLSVKIHMSPIDKLQQNMQSLQLCAHMHTETKTILHKINAFAVQYDNPSAVKTECIIAILLLIKDYPYEEKTEILEYLVVNCKLNSREVSLLDRWL